MGAAVMSKKSSSRDTSSFKYSYEMSTIKGPETVKRFRLGEQPARSPISPTSQ